MSLQTQIREQIKEAMKAKDSIRLGVVKGLVANFTNELVSLKRTPQDDLSDEEVLSVIRRSVKQRKDSIEQFTKGGRVDLADSEKAELTILETYLPAMMSRDDVTARAKAKMTELGIDLRVDSGQAKSGSTSSPQVKAGMLMGTLMKDLKGKADGDTVKSVIDELLG